MKTNVFYKVMMMALVAVFVTTMTACGGDSDDPLDNPNPIDNSSSQGENAGSNGHKVKYFIPCTDWNYTETEVKQYMSKENRVKARTTSTGTSWSNDDSVSSYYIQVWYYYDDNGKLYYSHVWYDTDKEYMEEDFKYIVSETERIYGVKLRMSYSTIIFQGEEVAANYLYSDGENGMWIEVVRSGTDGIAFDIQNKKPSVWPSKFAD